MNITLIASCVSIIVGIVVVVVNIGTVGMYIGKLEGFKELVNFRFNQQDAHLKEHNNFIIRLYEVERKQGIDEEKIEVANHRIADLEGSK